MNRTSIHTNLLCLGTLAICCPALLVAQTQQGSTSRTSAANNSTAAVQLDRATVPGSSLDRYFEPFKEELLREDPSRDGWESEAFHEASSKQLHHLGVLLEKLGNAGDSSGQALPELGEIIDTQIETTPLRPQALEVAYSNPPLKVVRNKRDAKPSMKTQSVREFLEQLKRLMQPYGGFHAHAHFKTVRVDIAPSGVAATTLTVLQLGGSGDGGGLQHTVWWQCGWKFFAVGDAPRLASVKVVEFEEVIASQARPIFQDCTGDVFKDSPSFAQQLVPDVDDWVATIDRRLGLDIVAIHGLAIGDVDGDGLDDLFLCEPGGLPNKLYLHKPDGSVRDVSAVTGVDFLESTRSALLIDIDNDGDQDMVAAVDRFIVFLENDGWGRFSRKAGFKTTATTVSLTAADFDLDGDLDIYLCGYFTMQDATEATIGLGNPIPFHDANNGARNVLFRNEGNWQFTDATDEVGLDVDNLRFSLAAAWEDYDLDGDADLYVANDYGRNCLYRNDDGRFVNVAAEAGVEDISAGMSVSWGDYNRDGLMDIYVSNMFSSAGNRISYQRRFKKSAEETTRREYQRFSRGNTLFENSGDGTFKDVTLASKVTMARWAWASNFMDLNNDGWEDLVVANGMLTREGDTGDL